MKKFILLCLFLTGCDVPTPQPNYATSIKQCSDKYFTPKVLAEAENYTNKQYAAILIKNNECERQATLSKLSSIDSDLINLMYTQKANIYEKYSRNSLSFAQMDESIQQTEVTFSNNVRQRELQRSMMSPKSVYTNCRPSYTGGFNCITY